MKRAGPLVLVLFCIIMVLSAGCTDDNAIPASTGSQPKVMSGSTGSNPDFDPIIGVWRSPGAVYKFEIMFDIEGKTRETYSSVPNVFYNGTWIPAGEKTYLVTRDTGDKTLWIHDASANTIYKKDMPGIVYSFYQGTGASTGRSTGTSGTTAVLSGTGDQIVPFYAAQSGLWLFNMQYSGESNFIVWLKDEKGKRVSLLANEIGTYSGIKPLNLNAGKYYLDITSSGPWTIKASLS
ncbi:MAG TPA: hypothetical protein PKM50_07950 [Methanoregula sp.]|nr:hypothetical protein [Methanoregula sp.]